MKKYTIEKLNNSTKIVVNVDNCEQIKKLDEIFKTCHDYLYNRLSYKDGNQCINIKNTEHSDTDYYMETGYTIIPFSQIDFQENLVECIEIW